MKLLHVYKENVTGEVRYVDAEIKKKEMCYILLWNIKLLNACKENVSAEER